MLKYLGGTVKNISALPKYSETKKYFGHGQKIFRQCRNILTQQKIFQPWPKNNSAMPKYFDTIKNISVMAKK